MIDNNYIFSALVKRYDALRLDAQNRAFEVNERLQRDEKWQANKYMLNDLRIKIARAKFEGKTENLTELEKQLQKLKEERADILKQKGLLEQDLTVNYSCKLCEDSGFLPSGKPCECFYKNLAIVCEDILGIKMPELPSFSDFEESGEKNKKLKALLLDYVNKFPPEKIKNLIFTGKPGTGKTFAAGCIANALKVNNYSVIYLSAVKLGDLFLRYHTSSLSDKQSIFALLTSCDLLVIDDLGTEPILKNVTVEYLTAILSERLNNKLAFIITTNLTLDEIQKRYTERLSSRISGSETARISFEGSDMRIKK